MREDGRLKCWVCSGCMLGNAVRSSDSHDADDMIHVKSQMTKRIIESFIDSELFKRIIAGVVKEVKSETAVIMSEMKNEIPKLRAETQTQSSEISRLVNVNKPRTK